MSAKAGWDEVGAGMEKGDRGHIVRARTGDAERSEAKGESAGAGTILTLSAL